MLVGFPVPRAPVPAAAMSRPLAVLFAAVVLPASLAAQVVPSVVPFPEKLPAVGYQAAFAKVGTGLYIAGQPTDSALRWLRGDGVTTVVVLRTPEELANREFVKFEEEKLVKELGMTWVHIPVRGDSTYPYSPEAVDRFNAALSAAKGKVLLHCTVAFRASHLYAAWLVKYRGIPVDSAVKIGKAINYGSTPFEGFVGQPLTVQAAPKKKG